MDNGQWTTGSNGAAFSLTEEFLQLKENYVRKFELMLVFTLRPPILRFSSSYYLNFNLPIESNEGNGEKFRVKSDRTAH